MRLKYIFTQVLKKAWPVFFIFLFLPFSVDAESGCSRQVLLPQQGVQRFYRSSLFVSWKDWRVREFDWSRDQQPLWDFSENCFDDGNGVVQVAFDHPFFSSLGLAYHAVVRAAVDVRGYVYQDDVQNIRFLGDFVSDIFPRLETQPRVVEYVRTMKPKHATLFVNNDLPFVAEDVTAEQFSRSFVFFPQSGAEGVYDQSPYYFLYDVQTGLIAYKLPLQTDLKTFPEIPEMLQQYKQASAAVSSRCSFAFTRDDTIEAFAPAQEDWYFTVTSKLPDCPPKFLARLTVADRTTLGIPDTPPFTVFTPTPHVPAFKLFPYSILTFFTVRQFFALFFPGFLGLLIMYAGMVIFTAHFLDTLVWRFNKSHKK